MIFKPSFFLILTVFFSLSFQEDGLHYTEKKASINQPFVQLSWTKNEKSVADFQLYDAIARFMAIPHKNYITNGLDVQMNVFSPLKSNVLFLFNGIQSDVLDINLNKNIPLFSYLLKDNHTNTFEFEEENEYNLEVRCFGFDYVREEFKQFFPSQFPVKDITKDTYFSSVDEIISVVSEQFPDVEIKMSGSLKSFYTEIATVLRFSSRLASSENKKELYFIGFRSIGYVKAEFGEDSVEFVTAVSMLKKTIEIALAKTKDVYNDKAIYESIFLPRMYDEHSDECNRYKNRKTGFLYSRSSILADNDTKNGTVPRQYANYTIPDDIIEWHLFMWTWIFLVIIVFFAIYTMYKMDVGEDSLLYRTTNLSTKNIK